MKSPKTLADLLLVLVIVAVFWFVATLSELSEHVAQFSQSYEALQLDELPLTLLVLSLGMAWFGWRRTLEAQQEIAERKRSEQQVQELLKHNSELLQRLFTAEEDERRALARELHDEMGQTSTAIRTEASVLQRSGGLSDEALGSAKRISESAQHLSQMTRNMLQRLRPASLDSMGLAHALTNLCDNWQVNTQIDCNLKLHDVPDNLNDYLSVTAYRLVQEALTNVARHSGATQVDIELNGSGPNLVMRIQDNGRGMPNTSTFTTGFGLLGIQERVASLSGNLRIESPEGKGVGLLVSLPKDSE